MKKWYADEGGYSHLLGTRPDTVGYALNDSPVGLAAWTIEKWYIWTAPPSGNLDDHFSKDDLLTNVTIYWLRKNIASANRYYREEGERPGIDDVANVPYGVARVATQPHEQPPQQLVERLYPDIRSWIDLPRGGHFVALEDPDSLATAIQGFFREIRNSHGAA
jgi:pimeloyl-ACP methyl ester carboxylesterase